MKNLSSIVLGVVLLTIFVFTAGVVRVHAPWWTPLFVILCVPIAVCAGAAIAFPVSYRITFGKWF